MNNLTVVIITKNEEHNISDAVKNAFSVAYKVIVVDSGSTDKTVDLARESGAYVITRDWDNDFAAQRNFGDKCVDTEWVLHLDADERISEELAYDIKKVLENSEERLYVISSKENLDKLTSDTIIASIDLKEFTEEGDYTVPVKVTELPSGCTYTKEVEVKIELTKK